jgi:hypothetical protein
MAEGRFIYYKYLVKKFGLSDGDYSRSSFPNKHWVRIHHQDKTYKIDLVFEHIYKDEDEHQKHERMKPSGLFDRIILVMYILFLFVRRPSLATYFIPYVLFIFAITLGLYSHIFS